MNIQFCSKEESLQEWYLALNHVGKDLQYWNGKGLYNGVKLQNNKSTNYEVGNKEKSVSLLQFNLQLNQLLMLINNLLPFPHIAYAKMFDHFAKGEEADDK